MWDWTGQWQTGWVNIIRMGQCHTSGSMSDWVGQFTVLWELVKCIYYYLLKYLVSKTIERHWFAGDIYISLNGVVHTTTRATLALPYSPLRATVTDAQVAAHSARRFRCPPRPPCRTSGRTWPGHLASDRAGCAVTWCRWTSRTPANGENTRLFHSKLCAAENLANMNSKRHLYLGIISNWYIILSDCSRWKRVIIIFFTHSSPIRLYIDAIPCNGIIADILYLTTVINVGTLQR